MKETKNIVKLLVFSLFIISCGNNKNGKKNVNNGVKEIKEKIEYKAFKYVDSFVDANKEMLNKNSALREQLEKKCTDDLKPLIAKGLYNEIPFELTYSTLHDGEAYGNFIYSDENYFVKVTCIIPDKILPELMDNEKYLIEFKFRNIVEGVYFKESNSKIDLPTINAYLESVKKVE